jgi:HEAT repeat protein
MQELEQSAAKSVSSTARKRMSARQRILFLVVAWLILLMPFLFWWNTWFGRQLSEKQLAEYLQDDKKPRHIQHALVQIGDRMTKNERAVARWYPDVVRLSTYPVEEVRNTDAWVMGQDVTSPDAVSAGFHQALLNMLHDPSLLVRGNAALSLVRFGDATGKPQIVALLQPATVTAPQSGKVIDTSSVGTPIHQHGLVAKLQVKGETVEVRSPIGGRVRTLSVQTGQMVAASADIATVAPEENQVWEALRALYLIGRPEDLPAVIPYERDSPDTSDRVRQQAKLTEQAIRER